MQINLKQPEIEAALSAYIANAGINLKGNDVIISFTAGRKGSGISAEIHILPSTTTEVAEQAPPPVAPPTGLFASA